MKGKKRTIWQRRYDDDDNIYSLRTATSREIGRIYEEFFGHLLSRTKMPICLNRIILFGAKFVWTFYQTFARLNRRILRHVSILLRLMEAYRVYFVVNSIYYDIIE